jgi:hypothetical protein
LVRVGDSSDAQFRKVEREQLPPEWTSRIDEISIEITRIKQKSKITWLFILIKRKETTRKDGIICGSGTPLARNRYYLVG